MSNEKLIVDDNNSGGYFVCHCEECGHIFSSEQSDGCTPNGYDGDYSDMLCPKCGAIDPPEAKNIGAIWNYQQRIINQQKYSIVSHLIKPKPAPEDQLCEIVRLASELRSKGIIAKYIIEDDFVIIYKFKNEDGEYFYLDSKYGDCITDLRKALEEGF